jgi:hypothetical protein
MQLAAVEQSYVPVAEPLNITSRVAAVPLTG